MKRWSILRFQTLKQWLVLFIIKTDIHFPHKVLRSNLEHLLISTLRVEQKNSWEMNKGRKRNSKRFGICVVSHNNEKAEVLQWQQTEKTFPIFSSVSNMRNYRKDRHNYVHTHLNWDFTNTEFHFIHFRKQLCLMNERLQTIYNSLCEEIVVTCIECYMKQNS